MALKSMSMMIVFVRDYAGMKDWYSKVLGLAFEQRRSSDDGQWGVFSFPGGGPALAIHGGLPLKPVVTDESGGGVPSIIPCISVDDIESTVSDLKDRGIRFVKETRELAGSGVLGADLIDPEGNLIQLLEVKH